MKTIYLCFFWKSGERPDLKPLSKSDHLHHDLEDILFTSDHFFIPKLYYEILEIPLTELETNKIIHIQWQNEHAEIIVTNFSFLKLGT